MRRFDWTAVHKRISTALSVIATASTAGGSAFALGPAEWRASFPADLGMWLLASGVMAAALVPIATSFKQSSLQK